MKTSKDSTMPKTREAKTSTNDWLQSIRSSTVIVGVIALIGVGITTMNRVMPWPTTDAVNAKLAEIAQKIDSNNKVAEIREQAIKDSISDLNTRVEKLDSRVEKLNDSVAEMKANTSRNSDETNHSKHYSD